MKNSKEFTVKVLGRSEYGPILLYQVVHEIPADTPRMAGAIGMADAQTNALTTCVYVISEEGNTLVPVDSVDIEGFVETAVKDYSVIISPINIRHEFRGQIANHGFPVGTKVLIRKVSSPGQEIVRILKQLEG